VNKQTKNTQQTQSKPFFHRWLESVWYENGKGRFLLMPLSILFCFMSQRRRKQQEATQQAFPVPIIVIGNISVGGTGKTPLVIALTQHLQQQGYKPCIITRGYTGKAEKWPLAVTNETDVNLSGDEAKLMALRTQVPVIASPKRIDAIRYALKHYADTCDCILSDDGLQHYKMHRDMEIAVIDGQRQFGNGHCLPAGPLREKPVRLAQCDLVIVNGASLAPYEHTLQISSNEWQSLDNTQHLPHTALQQVQIYTAIGNPQRFVDHLNDKGIMIAHCHFFPDHHHFTQDDFTTLDSTLPIVMTEKDAVKCQQLHLENAWYLPITAPLDNAFKIAFNSHFVTIAARDNSYE
jgi:tetraacyldisaccharide 4'-kinase